MSDAEIRKLERLVSQGDPEAREKLAQVLSRQIQDPKLVKPFIFYFIEGHADGESALRLAKASEIAKLEGWEVFWEHDQECAVIYKDEEFEECLMAILRNENGEILEILGGILDPSPDYAKVIEAELALQSLYVGRGADVIDEYLDYRLTHCGCWGAQVCRRCTDYI